MTQRLSNGQFKKGCVPHNKKESIEKICPVCNTVFTCQPYNKDRRKFCSKVCFYEGRNNTGLFEKGHVDLVPQEKRYHTEETKTKIKETQKKNRVFSSNNNIFKNIYRNISKKLMY